jgi:hypothetical protein
VSKLNHEYVSSPITVFKPQGYPTPGTTKPSKTALKSRNHNRVLKVTISKREKSQLIIQLAQGKQKKHGSMKDGKMEAAL